MTDVVPVSEWESSARPADSARLKLPTIWIVGTETTNSRMIWDALGAVNPVGTMSSAVANVCVKDMTVSDVNEQLYNFVFRLFRVFPKSSCI
jgi:hypothetical protein